jgi:Tol biopolymer transport system component
MCAHVRLTSLDVLVVLLAALLLPSASALATKSDPVRTLRSASSPLMRSTLLGITLILAAIAWGSAATSWAGVGRSAELADKAGLMRIVSIRPDGRGRRIEYPTTTFDPASDAMSPDGSQFATAAGDVITVTNVSTGIERTLMTARAGHGFAGDDLAPPAWSPDGTRLAVTDWESCPQPPASAEPCVIWTLFVVDLEGKVTAEIRGARNATWSPTGTALAFETDIDAYQEAESIAVAGADGQTWRRLTEEYGVWYSPVWSPNGRLVAFTGTGGNDSVDKLFIVRADGSAAPRSLGHWYSPVWSKNSKRLALTRYHYRARTDSDAGTLFTIRVDARDRYQLTDSHANALFPLWSPDGTRVAFAYDSGTGEHLAIAPARGGKVRPVTPAGAASIFPLSWANGRVTFVEGTS